MSTAYPTFGAFGMTAEKSRVAIGPTEPGSLSPLPVELRLVILELCAQMDILRVARLALTSREWYHTVYGTPGFWQELCRRRFGASAAEPDAHRTWLGTYVARYLAVCVRCGRQPYESSPLLIDEPKRARLCRPCLSKPEWIVVTETAADLTIERLGLEPHEVQHLALRQRSGGRFDWFPPRDSRFYALADILPLCVSKRQRFARSIVNALHEEAETSEELAWVRHFQGTLKTAVAASTDFNPLRRLILGHVTGPTLTFHPTQIAYLYNQSEAIRQSGFEILARRLLRLGMRLGEPGLVKDEDTLREADVIAKAAGRTGLITDLARLLDETHDFEDRHGQAHPIGWRDAIEAGIATPTTLAEHRLAQTCTGGYGARLCDRLYTLGCERECCAECCCAVGCPPHPRTTGTRLVRK